MPAGIFTWDKHEHNLCAGASCQDCRVDSLQLTHCHEEGQQPVHALSHGIQLILLLCCLTASKILQQKILKQ